MARITERSYISIGLLIPLLGGVAWLNTVHGEARSANEHIKMIEKGLGEYKQEEAAKDSETRGLLLEILRKVSRLEGKGKI